jgi:hypothetical protein
MQQQQQAIHSQVHPYERTVCTMQGGDATTTAAAAGVAIQEQLLNIGCDFPFLKL